MLTRPGSPPGPRWMRAASEAMAGGPRDPRGSPRRRRWVLAAWAVWGLLMLLGWWLREPVARVPMQPYASAARVAGLPLVAYGEHARGIVAVGGVAIGVVAVGGVAVGGIAVGGVAVGALGLAGVAAGLVALGGLALGGLALGGGAGGYWALGGLAVGAYAYAGGGVALGYHEAGGGQRERLLATR